MTAPYQSFRNIEYLTLPAQKLFLTGVQKRILVCIERFIFLFNDIRDVEYYI